MGEFIIAHKIALLLIGAALGGFILLTRGKGAQAAAGYPVDPYAGGSPSVGAGGGFDLSSLLPSGPAGPVLDPSASSDGTAGQAPAAVDNANANNTNTDSSGAPVMGTGPFGVPGMGAGSPNEFNIGIAGPGDYTIWGTPYGTVTPLAVGTPVGDDPYGTQALQDMWAANTQPAVFSTGPGVAPAVSLPVVSAPEVDLTPRATLGHAVAV